MTETTHYSGGKGWLPDDFNAQDQYYKAPQGLEAKTSVNLRDEYPELWAPAYDQLTTYSCVANASAAAFWFESKKQKLWNFTSPDPGPSRLFIYWNARAARIRQDDTITDEGTNIRYALKSLASKGVCSEEVWPFKLSDQVNARPDENAYTQALGHTIVRYGRLDADRPDHKEKEMTEEEKDQDGVDLLNDLRKCLSEGHPVVFGFWFYWETVPWVYDKSQGDDIWVLEDLKEKHKAPVESHGGHAVLAIGYDDKRELVLCQNSWGHPPNSGPFKSKDGLFWMPYKWIQDFEATDDYWMIRKEKAHSGA